MRVLVGNTGLIGKTLMESHLKFDFTFNSSNINLFDGVVEDGDELYLSCLPASKWLVNQDLPKDMENINNLIEVLQSKSYSRIVLFSTIDVYNAAPLGTDETYAVTSQIHGYGRNRYIFEMFVETFLTYKDLKVFRLPALYGKHIKKNVLFDLLNDNNVDSINLNSAYQWYNLENLAEDVEYYCGAYPKEKVINLFPEPVETTEVLKLFPKYSLTKFTDRVEYNYKTKFGKTGYAETKQDSLESIKDFINEYLRK